MLNELIARLLGKDIQKDEELVYEARPFVVKNDDGYFMSYAFAQVQYLPTGQHSSTGEDQPIAKALLINADADPQHRELEVSVLDLNEGRSVFGAYGASVWRDGITLRGYEPSGVFCEWFFNGDADRAILGPSVTAEPRRFSDTSDFWKQEDVASILAYEADPGYMQTWACRPLLIISSDGAVLFQGDRDIEYTPIDEPEPVAIVETCPGQGGSFSMHVLRETRLQSSRGSHSGTVLIGLAPDGLRNTWYTDLAATQFLSEQGP